MHVTSFLYEETRTIDGGIRCRLIKVALWPESQIVSAKWPRLISAICTAKTPRRRYLGVELKYNFGELVDLEPYLHLDNMIRFDFQKVLPQLSVILRQLSDASTDLKAVLATKIPKEQERVKNFRKNYGNTKVGEVNIDMVSCCGFGHVVHCLC